jgi:hypothetical protein
VKRKLDRKKYVVDSFFNFFFDIFSDIKIFHIFSMIRFEAVGRHAILQPTD